MLYIQGSCESVFAKKVKNELGLLAPRLALQEELTRSSTGQITKRCRVSVRTTLRPNYERGTRLIKALAASPRTIEIHDLIPGSAASDAAIRNEPALAAEIERRITEKPPRSFTVSRMFGSRIVVFYSPNMTWETRAWLNRKARTTVWEAFPKHIELAHELIHALRLSLGTYGRGSIWADRYRDASGRWVPETVGEENAATIGLGARNSAGRDTRLITENLLRSETAKRARAGKWPRERVGYQGRDPNTGTITETEEWGLMVAPRNPAPSPAR